MGTNYYVNGTSEYGEEPVKIHLGKNSMGWRFTLQANNFLFYKNWPEMKNWLADKRIVDEYGRDIEYDEFIKLVESKNDIKDPQCDFPDWHKHIGGYKFADCEFC